MTRAVRGLERTMVELGDSMGPDLVVGRVVGRLDPEALTRGLLAVLERHPLLACRVTDGRFVHQEPIARVEVVAAAPRDPDPRPLWQRVVEAETRRPFDLSLGSPLRAIWLEERDGGWLVVSAHHAVVDGTSLLRILHDLLAAATGASLGPPLPVGEAAVTHFPWVSAPLIRAAGPLALAAAARHAAAHPSLQAPRLPEAQPVRTLCAFRRGSAPAFRRLVASAKAERTTVGGAFLAATHFALARHLQRRGRLPPGDSVTVPIEVEVNLRPRAVPPVSDHHVGFWTGGVREAAPMRLDLPFWTVARALSCRVQEQIGWGIPALVHHAMDGVRGYLGTLEAAGVDVRANGGALALANVSNVGRWPHASRFGGARLTEVYGLAGCCLGGPAVIAWLRSIEDRFCYNTIANGAVLDAGELERLQDDVVGLLEGELAALTLGDWLREPRIAAAA